MPWTDRPGGSGNSNGGRGPWGQPGSGNGNGNDGSRRPGNRPSPDLEELLRSGRERFRRGGSGQGGGGGGRPDFSMPNGRVLGIGAVVLAVLYVASGFYTVSPGAKGVVTTFGQFSSVTDPGLNWHLPWPIQSRTIVDVDAERSVSINRNQSGGTSMLTSDLNIVDVEMTVNYKIRNDGAPPPGELPNAAKYIFNIEQPEDLVRAAAESALRQVVGESEYGPIISANRAAVNQGTQQILQDILDTYRSGIEVVRVNFGQADPPEPVIPAQRDVIDARSEAERRVNEATRYANSVVPRAVGEARQIELRAEAEAQRLVREARGQASRFSDVYEEYAMAPEVTRRRMYLETMEEIFPGLNKVIIDENAGGALPYLNLNELAREGRSNRTQNRTVTPGNSGGGQ